MKIDREQPVYNISSQTKKNVSAGREEKDVFTVTQSDEGLKHKTLLLQIDGLSKSSLEKAMEKGYTPNIKSLLERETHILKSMSCGIATVTNPILATIFYGIKLPGNDWYDKQSGKMTDAMNVEEKLRDESVKRGDRGLLTGGAAYSSPYSGGAEETGAIVSIFKKDMKQEGLKKTLLKEIKKEASLLKRGGYSLTKVGWKAVRDIFRIKGKMIEADLFNTKFDKNGPYLMSLDKNVVPQMATEGIKKAIDDHRPVAYLDYATYDEHAHCFGPDSEEAFSALGEIDKLIGQIIEKAGSSGDKYDLMVFSDHGQTPSNLFSKVYGVTADEAIKDMAKECNPSGYKDGDIEFSDAYSLGNIYFTKDKNFAVDIKDIEKQFPAFSDKLLGHPGIGLVVTRDGENYLLKGKEGSVVIDREGNLLKKEGNNPLNHFGDEALLRQYINNYMNVEQTGDIVIFGEYDGKKVLDFNTKFSFVSLHGGIGGEQTKPFIITDSSSPLAGKDVIEAMDLHRNL